MLKFQKSVLKYWIDREARMSVDLDNLTDRRAYVRNKIKQIRDDIFKGGK